MNTNEKEAHMTVKPDALKLHRKVLGALMKLLEIVDSNDTTNIKRNIFKLEDFLYTLERLLSDDATIIIKAEK